MTEDEEFETALEEAITLLSATPPDSHGARLDELVNRINAGRPAAPLPEEDPLSVRLEVLREKLDDLERRTGRPPATGLNNGGFMFPG